MCLLNHPLKIWSLVYFGWPQKQWTSTGRNWTLLIELQGTSFHETLLPSTWKGGINETLPQDKTNICKVWPRWKYLGVTCWMWMSYWHHTQYSSVKKGCAPSARVAPTHSWAKQGNEKRFERIVSLHRRSATNCPGFAAHALLSISLTFQLKTDNPVENSEFLGIFIYVCGVPFPLICIILLFKMLIISYWSHLLKITSCSSLLLLRKSRVWSDF